jgi:hypothetical protein
MAVTLEYGFYKDGINDCHFCLPDTMSQTIKSVNYYFYIAGDTDEIDHTMFYLSSSYFYE